MDAGKINVIGDAKSKPAADILAKNGQSQICDWHSQQKCVEGAGDRKLKEFDPGSDQKWKVSPPDPLSLLFRYFLELQSIYTIWE